MTEPNRKAFEDAVFAHYGRIKAMGWQNAQEGDTSRASLFWLQPNGQYGVQSIEAAWWGWQLRVSTMHTASVDSLYLMLDDGAQRRTSLENVRDVMTALQAHAGG